MGVDPHDPVLDPENFHPGPRDPHGVGVVDHRAVVAVGNGVKGCSPDETDGDYYPDCIWVGVGHIRRILLGRSVSGSQGDDLGLKGWGVKVGLARREGGNGVHLDPVPIRVDPAAGGLILWTDGEWASFRSRGPPEIVYIVLQQYL